MAWPGKNPSTPTFGNINLTETMTNLLKLIQNQIHISSRHGPVNASSPTLSNINLTQVIASLLVVWKITKKWLRNLYFHSYNFYMSYKLFSCLTSFSRGGPVNSSTPNFYNISLTETLPNLLFAI